MRDSGALIALSCGVFRLAGTPPLGYPDLVTVAARIPGGVICLIPALAFRELTTQIPHQVHVALPRGAEEPRLDHPPIKTYRFSDETFRVGRETHDLGGVSVSIYGGHPVLPRGGDVKVADLMRYASACRVAKAMRPYLEAIL